MIPKVFLYGSRAAAHVQQAANSSFRNVLQLQTAPVVAPSSGNTILNLPGHASSNWGANGSQHYSYQGYTGAGRAITQAQTSASNDTGRETDDSDERLTTRQLVHSAPPRTPATHSRRPRSNSLSLGSSGHIQRGHELGVLQVVQRHARFMHAFSTTPSDARTITTEFNIPPPSSANPRPTARRHSTSATSGPVSTESDDILPTIQSSFASGKADNSDSVVSQFKEAHEKKDVERILALIQEHSLLTVDPERRLPSRAHHLYSLAIVTLADTRQNNQPLSTIIELYNAMLRNDLTPDPLAYRRLLEVIIDREVEVQTILENLEKREWRKKLGASIEREDEQLRLDLSSEKNYESMVALFDAAANFRRVNIPSYIFGRIIRCSARRRDVDTALRVFARREQLFGPPDFYAYSSLLEAYHSVGDLAGAQEVFKDYVGRVTDGSLPGRPKDTDGDGPSDGASTRIYDRMLATFIECGHPDKALELLETMIDKGVKDGSLPLPSSDTYTRIISGFCKTGDVESALLWYRRLAQSPSAQDSQSYEPSASSIRASYAMWNPIFDTLGSRPSLHEFNAFVAEIIGTDVKMLTRDLQAFTGRNRLAIRNATGEERRELIEFLVRVLPTLTEKHLVGWVDRVNRATILEIVKHALDAALPREALALFRVAAVPMEATTRELAYPNHQRDPRYIKFRLWFAHVTRSIVDGCNRKDVPPAAGLRAALDVLHLSDELHVPPVPVDATLTQLYQADTDPALFSLQDWHHISSALGASELRALEGNHPSMVPIKRFIRDLAGVSDSNILNAVDLERLALILQKTRGYEEASALLQPLGRSALQHLSKSSPSKIPAEVESSPGSHFETLTEASSHISSSAESRTTSNTSIPTVHLDSAHSRFVNEHAALPMASHRGLVSPAQCFDRYEQGVQKGVYPFPEVVGRLINALGRLNELEKVQKLYADAQSILAALEHDKAQQSAGWFTIEDQMMAALAHAGNSDGANVHRLRIIQHGGAPSADSYGALIAAVKDTTDDSSLAYELFEESGRLNVTPNLYLFNTVISKLAKARKTEQALELFHRMPYLGIRPTPVTYAAVIGACCRVGDEESAVFLFDEMVQLPRYRPRVPVYNSMIQFFVTQKRDRERAIHYYRLLIGAGLQPTAHTYKLLLDAYGSIEPVDVNALDSTFMEASNKFELQGPHWASMINAWGCVQKDLDRALALFESIKTRVSSSLNLPDAVVYEALFNAIFAAGRLDLVPEFINRMRLDRVHMTAYIANVLIKGYASAGDIERARITFDSLVDPPVGMAAPHNHLAPQGVSSTAIPTDAPVYREPSSWEAIITAELAIGEHRRASELMERLDARMFPPAVTSRIRALFVEPSPA